MSKLQKLSNIYADYHASRTNQILHMIGVPLVILSVIIFLNWFYVGFIGVGTLKLSWPLILVISAYYFSLDHKVALVMLLIYLVLNAIMIVILMHVPFKTQLIVFAILFVIGWVLNFIGHAIEKKKPAFLHNLLQTLISPIFLLDEVCKHFGYQLVPGDDAKSKAKS
jgi:uncharacterized membrane protein YGL010W